MLKDEHSKEFSFPVAKSNQRKICLYNIKMILIHSNKNKDWKLNQVNEYYELFKFI